MNIRNVINDMKKYIIVFLVLFLAACSSVGEIVLPDASEVVEIEIVESVSENSVKIISADEIAEIIADIKANTKSKGRMSVNDTPVNISEYFILKFKKNADVQTVYLYKDKSRNYIEEPYAGIWRLDTDTFESIIARLHTK